MNIQDLKIRLTTNWSFLRLLYTAMGTFIMAQAIGNAEWVGIIFGGYFASMGLFGFGCASGNCYASNTTVPAKQNTSIDNIQFEEVK